MAIGLVAFFLCKQIYSAIETKKTTAHERKPEAGFSISFLPSNITSVILRLSY